MQHAALSIPSSDEQLQEMFMQAPQRCQDPGAAQPQAPLQPHATGAALLAHGLACVGSRRFVIATRNMRWHKAVEFR